MNRSHSISDDAIALIKDGLAIGRNWIAYPEAEYFLDKQHINFFRTKSGAITYAAFQNSKQKEFRIFYAGSMADVFKQINIELNNNISSKNHFI